MEANRQERIVLTFDVGTQSARALLVNNSGEILAKKQVQYDPAYVSPELGWTEQDPDMYYNVMCRCAKALKEELPTVFAKVEAVTISTIRDTSVCVDAEGKPLRPAIVWLDKRQAKGSPKISGAMKPVLKMMKLEGFFDLQYKKSHCNWIREEQPEIWEQTHKFLMLSSYLTYKLTGKFVDAAAALVGHIPFDNKARTWKTAKDVARPIFDIPTEMLPEPIETGNVMGYISAQVAEDTGLKEGLPVYPAGADKACEVIGMGCMKKEQVALSFGTMATMDFTSPDYYELYKNMAPYPSVIPGNFAPEFEIFRGYWLVSWFQKEFAELEKMAAETSNKSAIELLNEKMAEIPAGCDGLMFQPYFTPSMNMPFAKGGFVGMADYHGRIHMYRAVIEGINYSLMEGIKLAEKAGNFKVAEIRLGGGGSQSAEICQITANMFGIPVVRVHTHECTGLGASMAAFVGLGEFANFDEAASAMVHERDRFEPDMKEHALYQDLYEGVWKEIFGVLAPLYGKEQAIYAKYGK